MLHYMLSTVYNQYCCIYTNDFLIFEKEHHMILACHNISKAFGTTQILKEATFGVEEHEKTAIVGINGAGKSTLLKIIIGEMTPDDGEVILSRGKTIGYLAQQKMLTGNSTIYSEMQEAVRDLIEMEQRLREMEASMKHEQGEALTQLMEQYHRLSTEFDRRNGYAVESQITGVLKGLGFTEDDFNRSTDTLSGGQKTRVALGKLLLSSPDVILLDEPTNHLDMSSIAWLENYLINYKGAVIIVAHDRYFLNRVVTKVVEIDQGQVTTFSGNYNDYSVKKKMMREAALRAWMNQQAEIKHQEEVIAKLKSYNREKSIKRAESREKLLDHMEVLEKPTEVNTQIHLRLEPREPSGNDVLSVEGISKSFEDLTLFRDLSFEIRRGERVALIGDNGTGKSTMLKILMGMLDADTGTISLGSRVKIGYYDQEHQVLHPEKTLFEELSDAYPDLNNTQIRNVLASFLFTNDDVFKRISDLSGGERGRVSLAKLMLSKANFLILDEPTNHLDINSKEILESALNSYTGTILYVSHDRWFINQTATRILDLKNRTVVNYIGNYDYYLEKKDELTAIYAPDQTDLPAASASTATAASAPAAAVDSKADWKEAKEEAARQRKRKNELKKTEEKIAALEEEDMEIDASLEREEVFTDLSQVTKLSARKAEIAEELEILYDSWAELAE